VVFLGRQWFCLAAITYSFAMDGREIASSMDDIIVSSWIDQLDASSVVVITCAIHCL